MFVARDSELEKSVLELGRETLRVLERLTKQDAEIAELKDRVASLEGGPTR